MGRRIKLLLLAGILTISMAVPGKVSAAAVKSPYLTEQGIAKAPNVTAYVTGSKMSTSSEVTGKVGDISLTQKGDIQTFKDSGENIHYIVLIDNSGSVNNVQFEEAKNQLQSLRKSLKEKDAMTVYSVGTTSGTGEKTKVIDSTIEDGDKSESGDCKKIANITYMSGANSMTVLYRSLNQVLAEETAPDLRTIVLLITDGEDDSQGKDIDKVSTEEEVQDATVPVYGILLNRKGTGQADKVNYTKNKILAEKNCRGYYYDASTSTTADAVKTGFNTIKKLVNEETYVVKLKAKNNKTIGNSKLELTIDNKAAKAINMDYSNYKKDKTPPEFDGDVKKVSKNSIEFVLTDENGINKSDANDASHYTLQTKNKKGNGKIWTIDSVSASVSGEKATVTLTTKESLFKGDYVLKCTKIEDNSQDSVAMDDSLEFTLKEGVNPVIGTLTNIIKSYWWILLLLVVGIIGGLIVRAVKKKSVKIVEVNPEELNKADRKLVRLTITDRAGAIKDVEWDVEGSLFVGRSNICNIFFDDDRLSKQHFVIEVTKMGCYIVDLQSTNGTFVNGVKVVERRMLLDDDVITAGREKIVFHVPKNQALEGADDPDAV